MAQQEVTPAAGAEAVNPDSSAPAIDPIDALVDEFFGEEEQEEEPTADEASEPEFAEEGEAETDEPEAPAIDPPASWKAEEKELFKSLPPEVQATLSRREAEREKFVQTKAQEATNARQEAERQALTVVQQIAASHKTRLQAALDAFPVTEEPSYQLQNEDPYEFANRMDAHKYWSAQRQQVQQRIDAAEAEEQEAGKFLQAQEAQEFQTVLTEKFPEFLTDANLRTELGAIAIELGYPADQLQNVNATDVLAMRKAAEWKAKADQLDKLNKAKMENVRAAKSLPKVARPGAAPTRAQQSAARQEAAWDRVKATRGKDTNALADFLGL